MKAPLRSGEDGSTNWTYINAHTTELQSARGAATDLQARVEAASDKMDAAGDFFPFRIYQVFSQPLDPPHDWRRYKVRAGRVKETVASGTDSTDSNPDAEDLLYYDPAHPNYITVADSTPQFWFWLEIGADGSGNTTAAVRFGPDPTVSTYSDGTTSWTSTNPWSGFPVPDSAHAPIGWVDTQTKHADKIAIVRQLLRNDLVFTGGGGTECPYG